jgi:ABC-type transport system substrate-binding protein
VKPGAAALLWFEPEVPQALDPLHALSGAERRLSALAWDRLVDGDRSDVLSSWSTGDDGRYHLVLREDLHWADGRAVGAEDICFSIAAVADPVTASPLALGGALQGATCEVVGPGEAAVWLRVRPLRAAEAFEVPLLPAASFRGPAVAPGHPAFRRPIGTPPLRIAKTDVGWTVASSAKGGAVLLDIRGGEAPRDGSAGAARAAAGELAAWRAAGVPVWSAPATAPWAVWLDARTGPLADPSVRHALDAALDRVALRVAVDGTDLARPDAPLVLASGPFPPRDPRASAGIRPTVHDPDRVARLLAEAGFARTEAGYDLGGLPLTLAVPDGVDLPAARLASVVAAQLRVVGFALEVVPATLAAWASSWHTGLPVADLIVAQAPPMPGDAVTGWFRPGGPAPSTDSRTVDALRALDGARDEAERVAAGRELHAALADAATVLWLWHDDGWAPIPVPRAVPTPDDLFGRVDLWIWR